MTILTSMIHSLNSTLADLILDSYDPEHEIYLSEVLYDITRDCQNKIKKQIHKNALVVFNHRASFEGGSYSDIVCLDLRGFPEEWEAGWIEEND